MAYQLGEMSAAVTLDVSEFDNKMDRLPRKGESVFKKMAGLAAAYFSTRQILGFVVQSVAAFRDMEEATSKFNVTFRNMLKSAEKSANELVTVYGLSRQSARQMLADTGDLLIGFGFSSKAALELASATARLGIDLASFNNYAGGAKGAAEALTKGMLGETDSLKALGIVIRQDSDEYRNMVARMKQAKGVTDQQAQAMAVLTLATQQSGNAIGDYLRPGETLAQQGAMFAENFREMKAAAGEFLSELLNIPAAFGQVNSIIRTATDFIKKNTAEWVYSLQYVWAEIEAGAKIVWALVQPLAGYLGTAVLQVIENLQIGFRNVVSVGAWAFENLGAFAANFGKLAAAVGKDVLNVFLNLPRAILDTFVALGKGIFEILSNVGKNIWNVLSGKMSIGEALSASLDGVTGAFDKTMSEIGAANNKLLTELGSNTDKALKEIGATPFPELEMMVNPFVDPSKMVEQYANIGKTLDQINRDKLKAQQDAEERLRAKLAREEKSDKGDTARSNDATATGKAVGTFVAASLAQLMGSSTPEKETANNTRKIVKKMDKMTPVYSGS